MSKSLEAKRVEALEAAREFIEGFSDVSDGPYGEPVPNQAMQIVALIDEALSR